MRHMARIPVLNIIKKKVFDLESAAGIKYNRKKRVRMPLGSAKVREGKQLNFECNPKHIKTISYIYGQNLLDVEELDCPKIMNKT